MITTSQLGTILGVWAHPDDETFCCGALMAAAASNGQRVICLTATKGELGIQDTSKWPAEELGEIRDHELTAALGELGVSEHEWMGCRDGKCDVTDQREPVNHIRSVIEHAKVDTILTFGPDGLTGHPDHQTVSHWVDAAVHRSARKPVIYHAVQCRETYAKYMKLADEKLNMYFNIDEPPLRSRGECDIYFEASAEQIEQKYRAMAAMPSQQTTMLEVFTPEIFAKAFGVETFTRAKLNDESD